MPQDLQCSTVEKSNILAEKSPPTSTLLWSYQKQHYMRISHVPPFMGKTSTVRALLNPGLKQGHGVRLNLMMIRSHHRFFPRSLLFSERSWHYSSSLSSSLGISFNPIAGSISIPSPKGQLQLHRSFYQKYHFHPLVQTGAPSASPLPVPALIRVSVPAPVPSSKVSKP